MIRFPPKKKRLNSNNNNNNNNNSNNIRATDQSLKVDVRISFIISLQVRHLFHSKTSSCVAFRPLASDAINSCAFLFFLFFFCFFFAFGLSILFDFFFYFRRARPLKKDASREDVGSRFIVRPRVRSVRTNHRPRQQKEKKKRKRKKNNSVKPSNATLPVTGVFGRRRLGAHK